MSDVDIFEFQENDINNICTQDIQDCDIIPGTPLIETKKKKVRKKKNKVKDKIVVDYERNFKFSIQSTRTGQFNYNKPFTYHDVEEILMYTPNCLPKNNNIHLVGVHRFKNAKGHFLEKFCYNKTFISLDFTVAQGIPNKNDVVSIYGAIEFNNFVPVFVVRFFRKELEILVNKYMENLMEMRRYVPSDYLSTIS